MPMYEYKCGQCGQVFEVIQRFSDEPLTMHEGCGGAVERLLSAPALQFKGSGWYITDYAKGGSKPAGQKNEKNEKNGGASSESKSSDSKSESKSGSTSSDSSSSASSAPASSTSSGDSKK